MASPFIEAIKADVFIKLIGTGLETAVKAAGDKGGEALGKAMEEMFVTLPRPLIDDIIDHLNDWDDPQTAPGVSDLMAESAKINLKRHITLADLAGGENRLTRAFCKLLTLDPIDENGIYTAGHDKCRRRLLELGLMDDDDFNQSINFLLDEAFAEWFNHHILKKVGGAKEALKKAAEAGSREARVLYGMAKLVTLDAAAKLKEVDEKASQVIDANTADLNKRAKFI